MSEQTPINNTDDEILIRLAPLSEWDYDPITGEVIGMRRTYIMTKEEFRQLYE